MYLRTLWTSLKDFLESEGVAVVPGIAFGAEGLYKIFHSLPM